MDFDHMPIEIRRMIFKWVNDDFLYRFYLQLNSEFERLNHYDYYNRMYYYHNRAYRNLPYGFVSMKRTKEIWRVCRHWTCYKDKGVWLMRFLENVGLTFAK